MNILLTGAQGQVGWELAKLLPSLGNVTAVDVAELDLCDEAALRAFILRLKPTLLVNPAAYTAVDQAESDPGVAMKVNRDAVRVMADVMAGLGGVMVHYSTDYVFNGRLGAPFTETDPTGPLNQYGITKLAGEDALRASGVTHLNFRTSWVYGSRSKNFLLTVLRLAKERPELRIVEDQTGAPTWCRYLARVTFEVLQRCFGSGMALERLRAEQSGTYHLTAGGVTSWYGFTREALKQRNAGAGAAHPKAIPIATKDYPTPATRPLFSVLDNSKLLRTFGIQQVPWQQQLRECLAEMP
ncbi:MAG: dTDP-4-dehydrorhamnose reductase [Betaproteobacteria bacterium]|nr:dTDP-4-dehydrorhamnose reductase [Betaproteobacteria bacterium]